ncbi:hypothetical protein LCGC14_0861490 [marine sediment metagenome]|uniref:Uncharacterized protein n=1 Tax=marine sediment metagenome TaxID=412755 RepID=A0A0F9P754_9ZZZZ
MSNYTANDIRDIILNSAAELYYGRIVLYFKAGKIGVIEYQTTEIKDSEDKPAALRRDRGDLASR